MVCKSIKELYSELCAVSVTNGALSIKDESLLAKDADLLLENMILSDDPEIKNECYWIVWQAAQKAGIYPSSMQGFYEARGQGKMSGFTVPAMNLRTFTYEAASMIFRVAKKHNAGAFIFEIAKSEIGYTDQRPVEYVSVILAAAIKEGHRGPVFVQGDHFQVKASEYLKNPEQEVGKLRELIKEAIGAGFYNIDIDSSTLVDLDKKELIDQQQLNFEVCSLFTKFIREHQPKGVEISVGGEIGEVGKKNSSPEELRAFMQGHKRCVGHLKGISKMSIQTGTSHGGVVLPDGSLAQVSIDFNTLKTISEVARKEFGLSGAVQHGASTLPPEAFHKFPETETAEVHLATQFQNITYDHLPLSLKEKVYAWLRDNCAKERKPEDTSEQFIYKTRKQALGPFKKEFFGLTKDVKNNIASKLEEEFDFLFQQLRVQNTMPLVQKYVNQVPVDKKREDFGLLKDLGELEGAD